MPPSDDEIIRRVQRGERDLFLMLFDRYYSQLERFARCHVPDGDTARDMASETFLRAYQSVDRFRTGEQMTFKGYLFLICRRLLINERQRPTVSPISALSESEADDVEHQMDRRPLPLELLLDGERDNMVRMALQRLAAEDREIIALAFEQGLSRRDIMDILGKPSISAVTSHLHRAMRKLREVLVEQGYFLAERD